MIELEHRMLRYLRPFLNVFLPDPCIICGLKNPKDYFSKGMCRSCAENLPGTFLVRCLSCGLPLNSESYLKNATQQLKMHSLQCEICLKQDTFFDLTIVGANYAPPIDRLIHSLKFRKDVSLAVPLGEWLAIKVKRFQNTTLSSLFPLDQKEVLVGLRGKPPILTAVPISPERLASRGFNQSLEIAKNMSGILGVPLSHKILVRRRNQDIPSSNLSAADRYLALEDSMDSLGEVVGRTILLVDDVMTTGETLKAANQALKKAGASNVVNCVLARTLLVGSEYKEKPQIQNNPKISYD